jgi:glutamine cyclotransferase
MHSISKTLLHGLPLAAIFLSLAACDHAPAQLGYKVISTCPHDGGAYTQGLELNGNQLFESTGMYGESTVRELERATGKVLRKRPLSKEVFGEGLTIFNKEAWVLTWKENTVYVMEPDTFKFIRSYPYKGEGWGLTNDGTNLIMSDGSSELKFINPKDFSIIRTITVKYAQAGVKDLNELEWINGEIFANVYMTDRIARISPSDGRVTGWLDLSGLRHQLPTPNKAEVLNGIAFDKTSGHLIVTGKYWPAMFEIQLSEK